MDSHDQQLPQQQNTAPSYRAAPSFSSRPSLGFPLGTALLLVVIFCLSGVLSCCYHWDRLQSLRRRARGRRRAPGDGGDEESPGNGGGSAVHGLPSPPDKANVMDQYAKDLKGSLPVIMPGDRIPKFIAWPCPWDIPDFFETLPPPPPTSMVNPRRPRLRQPDCLVLQPEPPEPIGRV